MIARTQIQFGDFLIVSTLPMQHGEIEGVLYITDGLRTWQMQEVPVEQNPKES
jgi:hypothetical protein